MSPPASPVSEHDFARDESRSVVALSSARQSWAALSACGRAVSTASSLEDAIWRWRGGGGAACVVELPLGAEPPTKTLARLADGTERPIIALLDDASSPAALEALGAGATVVLARSAPLELVAATLKRLLPSETAIEHSHLSALVEGMRKLAPLHVVQRAYATYALGRLAGNKVRTASALQVDRRTLQRWERDASA